MQNVAQALLVLQLTGRGTDLGLIVGAQFLPLLVLSPVAGTVLDRVDLRRALLATQVACLSLALGLGVVTAMGSARLWTVFWFALGLGFTQVVDLPARQMFMYELVGREALPSAIALNNVSSNTARIFGPTLATFSAGLLGLAPCFFLNSATYLFMFGILWRIRLSGDMGRRAARLAPFTAGIRYVCSRRNLWVALLLALIIGVFAWEFQVTLPLLAAFAFHNKAAYGTMTTAMAVGAVLGGLISAASRGGSGRRFALLTAAFGASLAGRRLRPRPHDCTHRTCAGRRLGDIGHRTREHLPATDVRRFDAGKCGHVLDCGHPRHRTYRRPGGRHDSRSPWCPLGLGRRRNSHGARCTRGGAGASRRTRKTKHQGLSESETPRLALTTHKLETTHHSSTRSRGCIRPVGFILRRV